MIDVGGPLRTTAVVLFGAVGLYLLFNLVRSRDAGNASDVATAATERTTQGLSAVMIGVASVFVVATSSASALLGQAGELVAMFPSQVANVGLVGLGVLSISGVVELSTVGYLAAALALLAVIAVITR